MLKKHSILHLTINKEPDKFDYNEDLYLLLLFNPPSKHLEF